MYHLHRSVSCLSMQSHLLFLTSLLMSFLVKIYYNLLIIGLVVFCAFFGGLLNGVYNLFPSLNLVKDACLGHKIWEPFSQRTLTAVWLRGKWSGTTLSLLAMTTLSHQMMHVIFIIYVRDAAITPEFAMLIVYCQDASYKSRRFNFNLPWSY